MATVKSAPKQATQSQVTKTSSGSYDTPKGTSGRIDTNTGQLVASRPGKSNTPWVNADDPRSAAQKAAPLSNTNGNITMKEALAMPKDAPQVDPNAQAPQELVQQTNSIQQGITDLAKSRGLTLQKTPTGSYTTAPDVGAQLKQGLQNTQASGLPAANTAGAAAGVINQSIGSQQTESPSLMWDAEDNDPRISDYLIDYDDFHSPERQKESLVKEYQTLSKSLGLEALDEKLINAEAIIEGTEDDIRNEITSVGGLATNSQVLALANSRNKSLIANYNKLLATKSAVTTQLSTLMNLSIQDREFAEAEFDRKMNFAFKVAEFKQKATDNARTGLKWALENGAATTLLKNPYETQLAEKTLGLPSGSIAGIAAQQQADMKMKAVKEQAEIDNIYSQIAERKEKTAEGVKAQQRTKASVVKADTILTNVGTALTGLDKMSSGFFGGLTKNVPGTAAYDLNKTITTIKANIGFQELQAMREASPTGGALGNVANQELEALQAVLGSLDIGQGSTQLKENLNAVRDHYVNWLGTVGYEYDLETGNIIEITTE